MFGITEEVKVGVKSQVVIPAKIREQAKVSPGDVLIMTIDRNGRMSLVKKPEDWAKAAFGCAKGTWGNKPLEYLEKERQASWD